VPALPHDALAHDALATSSKARKAARAELGAIRIEENMAPRSDNGQHRRELFACVFTGAQAFRLA
jgi:hypothetical protein